MPQTKVQHSRLSTAVKPEARKKSVTGCQIIDIFCKHEVLKGAMGRYFIIFLKKTYLL